jgi:hypothetical protein
MCTDVYCLFVEYDAVSAETIIAMYNHCKL